MFRKVPSVKACENYLNEYSCDYIVYSEGMFTRVKPSFELEYLTCVTICREECCLCCLHSSAMQSPLCRLVRADPSISTFLKLADCSRKYNRCINRPSERQRAASQ
jgi:hypothetical protein